jgi:rhomboid protease GluP
MENTQRNSLLCPNCHKLISADEPQCPYCGISKPGSWWKTSLLAGGAFGPDQFIKWLIALNAGMFILSLLLNPRMPGFSLNPLTLLSPDDRSLLLLGATGTIPIDRFHRWWTVVSANYLHGSILHILFNMIALKQIGPLIMQEYGVYRTFIVYTVGGILGYWISYMAGITFTIGASAAVCSLIGAALFYGKSRGGYYGQNIFRQVGGWAVSIFIFGMLVPGINNWGHGGGIVGGVLVGFLVGYQEKSPEKLIHKTIARLCLVATLLVLGWAVATGLYYSIG